MCKIILNRFQACNALYTNKVPMSASNGACKDLLKDTSVLQDNIVDYKSDIDNLKSILHSINNWQIAKAVFFDHNKFSSKCVQEESTSTIKWSNIVAERRTIHRDFKKSTLYEIPTVIDVLVVLKVEDNLFVFYLLKLFPYIPFMYIPWKWKKSHSLCIFRQLII